MAFRRSTRALSLSCAGPNILTSNPKLSTVIQPSKAYYAANLHTKKMKVRSPPSVSSKARASLTCHKLITIFALAGIASTRPASHDTSKTLIAWDLRCDDGLTDFCESVGTCCDYGLHTEVADCMYSCKCFCKGTTLQWCW
jgi:hypothetical protein